MSATTTTVELPIQGMDCPSCASEVEALLNRLPGVFRVSVLLAAARATVEFAPDQVEVRHLAEAITRAGYQVPEEVVTTSAPATERLPGWEMLAGITAAVLLLATGEHLGLFDRLLAPVPAAVKAAALLAAGWKQFLAVGRGMMRGRLTSHSLLVLGMAAAAATGEWVTAGIVLFFMHVADRLEALCAGRSREALQRLVASRPATARVLEGATERQLPISEVAVGDRILVRPGERVPVDGTVLRGLAPVDESTVTGESLPVDKKPGDPVFAATLVQAGSLEIEATRVGADTTFAGIIRLVEEAESRKSGTQRFADRFTAWYLPGILVFAAATFFLSHRIENAVAVLVTACACSIALATPVVVIASVGSAARRGLLIKGGAALEQLATVDTVVLDKTGTVTTGQLEVAALETVNGGSAPAMLAAVAGLERQSEHPVGEAVVRYARHQGLHLGHAESFQAHPGRGVEGRIAGERWLVGNTRLLEEQGISIEQRNQQRVCQLQDEGRTVLLVARAGRLAGWIALSDTPRPEVREALEELRSLGIRRVLMLTGDHPASARRVADALRVECRAGLLPEGKTAVIRELQASGCRVMMVGDGINDAPALAQAHVGVGMGLRGVDVALEAADLTLLRDDWRLVPEAIRIGRKAVRTIRQNLFFSAFYNLCGLPLAAVGLLPPVYAAAAHNLPDLLIMLNSSRLLGRREKTSLAGSTGMPSSRTETMNPVRSPLPIHAVAAPRGLELPMLQAVAAPTVPHTHAGASGGCCSSAHHHSHHAHGCCGGHAAGEAH